MAIGVVSSDDFDLEIEKSNLNHSKSIIGTVIDKTPLGRGIGSEQVPNSLRKIIGETSEIDGRAEAINLAAQFGVSPSSVSAYANGATSTASYDNPNKQLNNHINDAKARIAKKARNRLVTALNEITPDKLAAAKLRDIASVAKDMSAIVKDMEPKNESNDGHNGPTFVLFAPPFRKEEYFDTVIVNE